MPSALGGALSDAKGDRKSTHPPRVALVSLRCCRFERAALRQLRLQPWDRLAVLALGRAVQLPTVTRMAYIEVRAEERSETAVGFRPPNTSRQLSEMTNVAGAYT